MAGGQLVDRHLGALQRFFGSKVGSEADVEDLVGDALEGCVKARDSFRREAAFKTFLFRIAHFTLCKHLRRKRCRPEQYDIENEPGMTESLESMVPLPLVSTRMRRVLVLRNSPERAPEYSNVKDE